MTPAEKAKLTRKKNEEARAAKRAADAALKQAARLALQRVFENQDATPAEIVRAGELLAELDKRY